MPAMVPESLWKDYSQLLERGRLEREDAWNRYRGDSSRDRRRLKEKYGAEFIKGRWLCKAFEPLGPNAGHGYNSFMTPRGVKRAVRMNTRNGPSKIDGVSGDSFHLEYADLNDFKRGPGGALAHTMFDELRKAAPGVYLGIGRLGFTRKQVDQLHPCMLEGPVASFVKQH